MTDSISLHEVQSSSSSSELAAPVALQTPTHSFYLNLTRDQYADLIECLQHLNQHAQCQQPSLIALGRQIDTQLHPQQRTSLHPHCQAQAVPRRTIIDAYRVQQIESYCYDAWSQCFPQPVMARCFFSFFLFHLITSSIRGWHSHRHVFALSLSCPSIPSIMVSLL